MFFYQEGEPPNVDGTIFWSSVHFLDIADLHFGFLTGY